MANEYLMNKWKVWFQFIDRKHTGKVSREDIKEEEEAYAKSVHLEGERKEEFIAASDKLVDELIFHGKSGAITEAEFLELTNNDYKADKEKFNEKMRKALSVDFEFFDRNKTGAVTEEEIVVAFKAFGLENAEWCKKYFQMFNPKEGKVHAKEYIEVMLPFLASEDSSAKDPVLELFESYPEK